MTSTDPNSAGPNSVNGQDAPAGQGAPVTRRDKTRRTAVAAVVAGVLGGGAIGLLATVPSLGNAAAPETTVAAGSPTSVPDTAAPDRERADTDHDDTDHVAKLREQLQALVDDGTITAEQADAVAAHLVANRPQRGPEGRRPDGRGGPMAENADEFAQLLGLADGAELRTELQSGRTIAEIAQANGVDIETVKNYLRDEIKARLDQAVADGEIDQATADEKLANADEMIDNKINSTMPAHGPKGRRGQHPGDGDSANGDAGNGNAPNIAGNAPNIVGQSDN